MNFKLGLSIFLIYNFFYLVNLEKQIQIVQEPAVLLENIDDFCYHITLILTITVLLNVWFIFRLMIFLEDAKSSIGKEFSFLNEAIWLIAPGILLLVMCFISDCGQVNCMEAPVPAEQSPEASASSAKRLCLPPRVAHHSVSADTLAFALEDPGAKAIAKSADLSAFVSKVPADPVVVEPVAEPPKVRLSGRILHHSSGTKFVCFAERRN